MLIIYYWERRHYSGNSFWKKSWFNAYVAVNRFFGSIVRSLSIKSARLSFILYKNYNKYLLTTHLIVWSETLSASSVLSSLVQVTDMLSILSPQANFHLSRSHTFHISAQFIVHPCPLKKVLVGEPFPQRHSPRTTYLQLQCSCVSQGVIQEHDTTKWPLYWYNLLFHSLGRRFLPTRNLQV